MFVLMAVVISLAGCKSAPDIPKGREYERGGIYSNPNRVNPLTGRYPSGMSTLF
jgi:hypothetical protein